MFCVRIFQLFFRQTALVLSNYVILVSFVGLAALLAVDIVQVTGEGSSDDFTEDHHQIRRNPR